MVRIWLLYLRLRAELLLNNEAVAVYADTEYDCYVYGLEYPLLLYAQKLSTEQLGVIIYAYGGSGNDVSYEGTSCLSQLGWKIVMILVGAGEELDVLSVESVIFQVDLGEHFLGCEILLYILFALIHLF
ncbi:MAG: hypothetical protein EZS28_050182 [Streblomastix strix]|uniref:Uncharacterized protein n=1 Tax=Streblomastix strix TaxID=222440 RepID=A0A5J4T9E7_9EUKA|nr:MAG: hypothetical protein EZS28_050182 [Streblomastix strix]